MRLLFLLSVIFFITSANAYSFPEEKLVRAIRNG